MMLELSGPRPKCGRPVSFAHGLCATRSAGLRHSLGQRSRVDVAISLNRSLRSLHAKSGTGYRAVRRTNEGGLPGPCESSPDSKSRRHASQLAGAPSAPVSDPRRDIWLDWTSVVEGKSVSVRLAQGGRRTM